MRYADSFCTYTESMEGGHTYTFTGPCKVTNKPYSVTIKAEELYAYRQGQLIQDAMPSLSPPDREFLITGYSPEGWDSVFKDEEDDEDDKTDLVEV